jgi:IS30 family transposase
MRQTPTFDRGVCTLLHPVNVAHRRQINHWQGGLMLFKQPFGQSNLASVIAVR